MMYNSSSYPYLSLANRYQADYGMVLHYVSVLEKAHVANKMPFPDVPVLTAAEKVARDRLPSPVKEDAIRTFTTEMERRCRG